MKKINAILLMTLLGVVTFTGCKDDDETPTAATTKNLTIDLSGLEDLGPDFRYEGWIIVDGTPISAGLFTVDSEGNASQTSFSLPIADLDLATKYVLTIEPNPDSDPTPSKVHILAGDFSGTNATLSIGDGAALGTDFVSAAGTFILATPTDDNDDMNEESGVWFLDPDAGPAAGLNLPVLPEGWAYEGWAVIDGTPISTGTFTSVSGNDASSAFSGTFMAPPFPGEDFLINAPDGLTFPTDLTSATIVISVEPVPDNSAAPFLLKPLVTKLDNAATRTALTLDNNITNTNPTGTVTR
ncbi:MAG: hypothetical protein COA58_05905 [Bacteroidetes bacterium]|nr:MAG: hypothetical protein COA58_05905 [Bacteroidota bacterium]